MGMVRIDIFYQRGSKIPFFLEVPMYGRCPTFDQYVLRHSSHTIPDEWKGRTISKIPGGCNRISSICRREGISSLRIKVFRTIRKNKSTKDQNSSHRLSVKGH